MSRGHRPSARAAIEAAFRAAIAATDPAVAVARSCRVAGDRLTIGGREELELSVIAGVWLVGAGKASAGLARAVVELLGRRVRGGSIVVRDPPPYAIPGVRVRLAGHPYPDDRSGVAAAEALEIAASARHDDLVVCLLSGGASSLWAAPPAGVPMADLRALYVALVRSGAPIQEVNLVRKQVSRIAGGRLARACAARRLVTLAISDVVDGPDDAIGSGPTLPGRGTCREALSILRDRAVAVPESVLRHLRECDRSVRGSGRRREKDGGIETSFHVVSSIDDAIDAASSALTDLGYPVRVVDRRLHGEAREVGGEIADVALAARDRDSSRLALLWGGETTVTVTGDGQGGRNQELALAAAFRLDAAGDITIASIATDGSDGPTDAAGAFADGGTLARAAATGVDPRRALDRNDSYAALDASGDLIRTGPTGTNVNDLTIAIID